MKLFRTGIFALAAVLAATAFVYADLSDLIHFKPQGEERGARVQGGLQQAQPSSLTPAQQGEPFALTQSLLLDAVRSDLISHYEVKGDLVLTPLQKWHEMPLSSDSWKLEVTTYPSGGLEPRFALRFKIHSEGRLVGEWTWTLRAELWQDAFVARKQINAGSAMDIADFTIRRVDGLRLRDALITPSVALSNYAARSTIPANKPLFWNDVEARAIVHKGKTVKVVAVQGALEIQMSAIAMEHGAMGDIVRVRNPQSNKRIQGEVIDENTVLIYF